MLGREGCGVDDSSAVVVAAVVVSTSDSGLGKGCHVAGNWLSVCRQAKALLLLYGAIMLTMRVRRRGRAKV